MLRFNPALNYEIKNSMYFLMNNINDDFAKNTISGLLDFIFNIKLNSSNLNAQTGLKEKRLKNKSCRYHVKKILAGIIAVICGPRNYYFLRRSKRESCCCYFFLLLLLLLFYQKGFWRFRYTAQIVNNRNITGQKQKTKISSQ